MFLDENGSRLWEVHIFQKKQNTGYHHSKKFLKVSEAYKDQREQIIKQKGLIIKNLDLKKNSVLNQDLKPILEMSLGHLDPVKGGYKGAPKFPTFIYSKHCFIFNSTKDQST